MIEKRDNKIALIRAAAHLFQKQGYNASGVSQIIKESGTPRGSFYYYFPKGKEELAHATILHTGEEIRQLLEHTFDQAETFTSGIDVVTNKIAVWFEKSGFKFGCPITNIHLEQTPANPLLAKASKQVFYSWLETVEKFAQRDGYIENSSETAQALITGLEGAWILSRATQSRKPFLIAAKMVKAIINT